MKKITTLTIAVILLLSFENVLLSQNSVIDSVKAELPKATNAVDSFHIYDELCWQWIYSDPKKATNYADSAYISAVETGKDSLLFISLNTKCSAHQSNSQFEKSAEFGLEGRKVAKRMNNVRNLRIVNNNVANALMYLGQIDSAISLHSENLDLAYSQPDSIAIVKSLINISACYTKKSDYEKSILHLIDAKKIVDQPSKLNYTPDLLIGIPLNIGAAYLLLSDYGNAIKYLNEALDIAKRSDKTKTPLPRIYFNLGEAYFEKQQLKKARYYHLLVINDTSFNINLKSNAYYGLAQINDKEGDLDEGLKNIQTSIDIDKKAGRNDEIFTSYLVMAHLYNAKKQYHLAKNIFQHEITPYHLETSTSIAYHDYLAEKLRTNLGAMGEDELVENLDSLLIINDSIFSKEKYHLIAEAKTKYETAQLEAENQLLAQKNKANHAKIRSRNILMGVLFALLATFLALYVSVRKNLKKTKLLSSLLHEKQEQLLLKNKKLLQTSEQSKSISHEKEKELVQKEKHIAILEKEHKERIEKLEKEHQERLDAIKNGNGRQRARKQSKIEGQSIILTDKNDTQIPLSDIIYLEARDKSVFIYLLDGSEIREWQSLKTFIRLLSGQGFIQIHRSFLVNPIHIQEYKKDVLFLSNGDELKISDSFLETTLEKLDGLSLQNMDEPS